MAKQTINLGTSANKGDGDPLRTAFDKVNDNFDEVYSLLGAEGGDTDDVVAPMLVHNDHTNITVTRDDAANKIIFSVDPYDGDITGSVFGDDSTLLVDGVNSNIPKANIEDSANWDTAFAWGNHASAGYQVAGAPHDGDIEGSVFGDDSTLLVDGINNKIVGTVNGTVNASVFESTDSKVKMGTNAITNGVYGIAIGTGSEQDSYGITVGQDSQADTYGVTVGAFAGTKHVDNNTVYTVALGAFAQQNANPGDITGIGAIAIGALAGDSNQGANSIAIGRYAGRNNQAAKSIVINATDSNLENTTADSLVIKPIRSAVGTTIMMYDVTSGEVTHNAVIPYPANAGVSWDGVAPTTVDGAIDRLASYTQDFAVSTDAHWADPNPADITDAINRLAAAIYALNGNTGI